MALNAVGAVEHMKTKKSECYICGGPLYGYTNHIPYCEDHWPDEPEVEEPEEAKEEEKTPTTWPPSFYTLSGIPSDS